MAGVLLIKHNPCENCACYGWDQPEDKASVLKCSRCKQAFYCSKQCQLEHWEKVHKKNCRYLAELKIFPNSRHDESTCLVCKVKTGKKNMTNPDNTVLHCIMSVANQRVINIDLALPLAVGLAATTGEFMMKAEATITYMMRLLVKLSMHTVWWLAKGVVEDLFSRLSIVRRRCWGAYLITGIKEHTGLSRCW